MSEFPGSLDTDQNEDVMRVWFEKIEEYVGKVKEKMGKSREPLFIDLTSNAFGDLPKIGFGIAVIDDEGIRLFQDMKSYTKTLQSSRDIYGRNF